MQADVDGDEVVVEVVVEGEPERTYRGHDVEAALLQLREDFDRMRRLLLINRFRREAFVTPMSRQMSNGLSCYLVTRGRAVHPGQIVSCLDPADEVDVVPAWEARAFIAEWQANPPWYVRLPWLGRLRGSRRH